MKRRWHARTISRSRGPNPLFYAADDGVPSSAWREGQLVSRWTPCLHLSYDSFGDGPAIQPTTGVT